MKGKYPVLYERQIKHPVTGKKYNPAIDWRLAIADVAKQYFNKPIPKDTPIEICSWVLIPRPKSVKRLSPVVKPDLDNWTYLHHNSLEGIAYENDSQIVHQDEWKLYVDDPFKMGLVIIIRILDNKDIENELSQIERIQHEIS